MVNQATAIGMLAIFLIAACVPSADKQGIVVESTEFTTENGLRPSGTLYTPETGEIAVLLAHQGTPDTDQQSWQPFAEYITEHGFAALTFDFRGHGQSEG